MEMLNGKSAIILSFEINETTRCLVFGERKSSRNRFQAILGERNNLVKNEILKMISEDQRHRYSHLDYNHKNRLTLENG